MTFTTQVIGSKTFSGTHEANMSASRYVSRYLRPPWINGILKLETDHFIKFIKDLEVDLVTYNQACIQSESPVDFHRNQPPIIYDVLHVPAIDVY